MEPDENGGEQSPLTSLVKMDGESARIMADSLFRSAPTEALINRSKPERATQTATRSVWRTALDALKQNPQLSWIDPLVRGANRGPNEVAKGLTQAHDYLEKVAGPTPLSTVVHLADLANRGLSRIMGDEDYAGIARDGLVLNKKVEQALGPDTNEGFHAFVRDAAQFAAASAVLPMGGVEEAAAGLVAKTVAKKGVQKLVGKAAAGMAADAFGFDPRQERISNLMAEWLKDAPLGLDKPFRALATNPEDSIAKARFKASLEGVLLGSTVDVLIHGVPKLAGAAKEAVFSTEKYDGPTFASVLTPEELAAPTPDIFTVQETASGTHRVVPAAESAVVPVGMPEFPTREEAETVAASLGVATRNATRKIEVNDQQVSYFRQLAQWIHASGNYEAFQRGELNVDTGEFVGGYHDINFRYDMSPEETGHVISSLATVFRKELDEARIPLGSRIDPKGGASISNAETLAGAVRDHNFKSAGDISGEMAQAKETIDKVPSLLLASRVVRMNLAQQAEVLARAMEASPSNIVAHGEFIKVTNTLLDSFVNEAGVRSGLGRALQSLQMEVGKAGANLSRSGRKAFKRMMGSDDEPLEVLHFDLLDEPATPEDFAALDMTRDMHGESGMATAPVTPESVVLPEGGAGRSGSTATAVGKAKGDVGAENLRNEAERIKAERGGNTPEADMAAMEQAARNTASGKKAASPAGKNTFTLVDEAQHNIDEALKKLDKEQLERERQNVPTEKEADAKAAKNDKAAERAVAKDKERIKAAAEAAGLTQEDMDLAKRRLRAAGNIIEDKRAAAATDPLAGLSEDEVSDLASLNAERIRRLADAERESPLKDPRPAKEKKAPKPKSSAGKNTYTLVDEAQHRMDAADKKISDAVDDAVMDKRAAKGVAKDQPAAVADAAKQMEVSDEDFQLAKDRLKAIRETISEKRAAGGSKVIDWSRYSQEDIADLASLHVEHVKRLADEQRASPMVPRRERTVHLTARQARQLARDLTFTPRNEAERDQMVRAVLGMGKKVTEEKADAPPSWWDRVAKVRAWSMLSAPATSVVNFVSAVSVAHYRPMEGLLGAAVRGDTAGVQRQLSLVEGMLQSYRDAVQEGWKSLKSGSTVLTSKDASVPQTGALTWTKPISAVVNSSQRLMTAGDEFASQLAYRGHLFMQAMEHARAAGVTDPAEIAKRVQDQIESSFNEMGRGTNPQAMSYAMQTNLRNQLEGGILGTLERATIEHPVLRILFPFVRIPSNLIRYQIDRAPIVGMLSSRNIEGWAAKGMQRDEVIGRQMAGAMFWTTGYALASAGMITGGGPKDPELRRAWLGQDGQLHQPYSVKIGDKWVSYRRFEPLLTPLSIMADVHDMVGELDEPTATQVVDAVVAGLGQNLISKTYFKTLSDTFYAFGSGKAAAVDAFIDGLASSFVPNIAQRGNPDDTLRTTRDFVDRLKARVPYFSETLEPRRNIYGEKVKKPGNQFQREFNPFTMTDVKATPEDVEMLRLGLGMSMPNPKKFGVDLRDRTLLGTNQSPYDRWMELMSQPIIEGQPPLREFLREFVKSDEYKSLTDNANGYEGTKQLAVEQIIRGYRAAAFAKMYDESETLQRAIEQSAAARGDVLTGDPDLAEALADGKKSTPDQVRGLMQEALQSYSP